MFKKEGFRYFQEMMAAVRDKVTDLIFRARVVGAAQARNAYKETAAVHEAPGGYGVAENLAATAGAMKGQPPAEMQEAADQTQGEGRQGQDHRPRSPKGRPQRLLPLRQRKEIQKMLRRRRGVINETRILR